MQNDKILLGYLNDKPYMSSDGHILVIGSCRTGKTQDFVKPNLLKLTDSVIVIGRDDDGLIEDTLAFRRDTLKQNIYEINRTADFYELIRDKEGSDQDKTNNFESRFSLYLLESPYDSKSESNYHKINLVLKVLCFGVARCSNNNIHSNPLTVIIDDISLFDIEKSDILKCLMEGRKYNVRLVIITQSINHIKETYGHETTQEILNNCGTKLFFPVNDPADTEYICNISGLCTDCRADEYLTPADILSKNNKLLLIESGRKPEILNKINLKK